MVEISLSGSGEGPGWATAPGYSTAAFLLDVRVGGAISRLWGARRADPLVIELLAVIRRATLIPQFSEAELFCEFEIPGMPDEA